MMSGTTIGIYAAQNASETRPTTSGRGVFEFKRAAGSVAHSIVLGYYARSTSTADSSDYQTLAGTVTIPAGQRTVAVNVIPIDDSAVEGTESLTLVLMSRSDATNVHNSASITIADNDTTVTPQTGWFGGTRTDRAAFSVNSGSVARTNEPSDYSINFSSVLNGLNKTGSLNDASIKVVEVSADGSTALDNNVTYQFDHAASGYNASTNASGDLVVNLTGTTAANTTRHYQVYFDTIGSSTTYTAPTFTPLVATTDNVNDASGTNSVKIQTQTATYYYQKPYGAFSQIIDTEGNDWVSWNSTPGSAGEFRGTPNLGVIGFHPGRAPTKTDGSADTMSTTIVSSGPLKTVLKSTAATTGNTATWEIYPTFARLSVSLGSSETRNYWFLYEATPGGSGPNSNDHVVGSDGNTPVSTSGSTLDATYTNNNDSNTNFNHNGNEFAYIDDTALNSGNGRYFFAVHNNADNATDSYYDLDNNMTVLGIGRDNSGGTSTAELTGTNVFTIGLANGGSNFASASSYIQGEYKDLTLTAGASAKLS